MTARRRDGLLLFGLLGGPIAWAVQLEAQYMATPYLCGSRLAPLVHLATAFALAITGLALVAARRARSAGGDDGDVTDARARSMGAAGVYTSAFFLLVVVVQGLPALLLDPCR